MTITDPVLKWKKTHLTYRVNGNNHLGGPHLDEFSEQHVITHDAFAFGTFYLFLEAINGMNNCALLTTVYSLPLFLFQ